MRPLVSIIIPIYNSELFLAETIQCAVSQTWPNKEIILIDDGSTDNSYIIANSYQHLGVKLFQQENKGAASARNLGLANAIGDFIQFLDGDDLISPTKIENQVLALNGHADQIAVCKTVHFFSGDDLRKLKPSSYEEDFVYTTSDTVQFITNLWGGYTGNGSMITINAWLTPKKLIDQVGYWNENLSLDDDGEFFSRIVLNAKKILKTEGFAYYRKTKNATLSSRRNLTGLQSLFHSVLSKKSELLKRSNSKAAKRAINRLLMDVALYSYPEYPDLVRSVELSFTNEKPEIPNLGGKLINLIARFAGWKFAKRLQNFRR